MNLNNSSCQIFDVAARNMTKKVCYVNVNGITSSASVD